MRQIKLPDAERRIPKSIKLSPSEVAEIEDKANASGLAFGTFVRTVLLDHPAPRPVTRPSASLEILSAIRLECGRIQDKLDAVAADHNVASILEAIQNTRAALLQWNRTLKNAIGRRK